MNEPQASDNRTNRVDDLPVEFCPQCSARLENRHCKAQCPRCGYFMSCSEFD